MFNKSFFLCFCALCYPSIAVAMPPVRCLARLQLVMFRTYLDYHIKAAKAYLHARMRARVDGWLAVLNRAQPDEPFGGKEKRTASGKTFVASSRGVGAADSLLGSSLSSSSAPSPRV